MRASRPACGVCGGGESFCSVRAREVRLLVIGTN